MPFPELYVETEDYVLQRCEAYKSLRKEFQGDMKNLLLEDIISTLFSSKKPLYLASKFISKVLELHDNIVKARTIYTQPRTIYTSHKNNCRAELS